MGFVLALSAQSRAMREFRASFCFSPSGLGYDAIIRANAVRKVKEMTSAQLGTLKFFALLFLLPGLAGLIVSALVSIRYLDTLPRQPVFEESRVIPRGIHGTIVYQTQQEDRKLNLMEYSSVSVFGVGLLLGLVYLEKWGSAQSRAADDEQDLAQRTS